MTKPKREWDSKDKAAAAEAAALTKLYGLRPKQEGRHKRIAYGSQFWKVRG